MEILSAGDLVKTFVENKAIQGIFSICTITGQSYCPWKDRKLKKFVKSQNTAVQGKYHEKMPWNGSYGLVYRGPLLSFLHSCKQIFVNKYLHKDKKVFCVVLRLCKKSASPFFPKVPNGCLCQQLFYSPDHYRFVFEARKIIYKAGQ